MYAIPSRNGPYLTGGKRYFVWSGPGGTWEIIDDNGFARTILKEDGHRSSHLPPMPMQKEYRSKDLGIIRFQYQYQ